MSAADDLARRATAGGNARGCAARRVQRRASCRRSTTSFARTTASTGARAGRGQRQHRAAGVPQLELVDDLGRAGRRQIDDVDRPAARLRDVGGATVAATAPASARPARASTPAGDRAVDADLGPADLAAARRQHGGVAADGDGALALADLVARRRPACDPVGVPAGTRTTRPPSRVRPRTAAGRPPTTTGRLPPERAAADPERLADDRDAVRRLHRQRPRQRHVPAAHVDDRADLRGGASSRRCRRGPRQSCRPARRRRPPARQPATGDRGRRSLHNGPSVIWKPIRLLGTSGSSSYLAMTFLARVEHLHLRQHQHLHRPVRRHAGGDRPDDLRPRVVLERHRGG